MAVRKFEGYSLLAIEVVIIFLNILAIIVIFRFKKKYNPDILIFSLAIADLLKALIPLNMSLYTYLSENGMAEGSPSCVIFGWTAFTLNSGIMLVMTVMAIDRYIAICWPFKYKHFLSKRRLIYAIIAVFVFSGIHSALPLVGIGKMRSYNNGSFCHFDFDSSKPANQGYSIFVLALEISMLVVVIYCYTRAMFSVRGLIKRQRRMSTPSRDIDGADSKRRAMNRMFARLMIVMMVAFCLSWLLFLVVVLQHVSGWFQITPYAHFWSMRLAVVNSVLNPLIGAAMCKPYRKGYLFILCKCLHCCGLCSSYKTDDPWMRLRKLSVSSRHSAEKDPVTPATNETALKVKSNLSVSCQDSGIVPDSIGYHQGGVINAACEMDPSQADKIHCITGDGRIKERPRLHTKRISFKDEVEAEQVELLREENEDERAIACTHDQTIHPQQQFTGSFSSHPETGQVGICLQEGDNGNSNVITSKMNQSQSLFEHQSNPGDDFNPSIVKPQNNSVLPLSSRGDESLKQDIIMTEKINYEVQTPIVNALIDNNELSLNNRYATAETLLKDPGGQNELNLSEEAKVTEISEHCQCTRFKDSEPKQKEALLQTLQITHFPVGTNSDINTTTVQSSMLSNIQRSQSSHSFSRSYSIIERTNITYFPGTKPRVQSLANDFSANGRNITVTPEDKTQKRQNLCQHHYSIEPATPIRPFYTGPSFDSRRCRSSLRRTKSLESALKKKPHYKSDNSTSRAFDLPVFQRHSAVLTGEQFKKIRGHSEPDLTLSLPETILTSPHEPPHTGSFKNYAAGEQRGLFTNTGFYKENGNRSQRRACDLHITGPSSRIYKELSELSPKELEREVFC